MPYILDLDVQIENILPKEILWVTIKPESGESFIIAPIKSPRNGLSACTILEQGKNLNEEQIKRTSELVLNPVSYGAGQEVVLWRRFPPWSIKFNFAIRLHRGQQFLDIFISLVGNSGWAFFHSAGNYMCEWNWVGAEKRQLAHELFPEYSPKSPDSAWRKGTIKYLKDKLYQKENN